MKLTGANYAGNIKNSNFKDIVIEDHIFPQVFDIKKSALKRFVLDKYYIDDQACICCTLCSRNCPSSSLIGGIKQLHSINQQKCTKCGICYENCPVDAIIKLG